MMGPCSHVLPTTQPAQLLLSIRRESLALAFVDFLLLDPVAQGLCGDTEFGGYPGYGMLFVRSSYQPDRLAAEFRRVRRRWESKQ